MTRAGETRARRQRDRAARIAADFENADPNGTQAEVDARAGGRRVSAPVTMTHDHKDKVHVVHVDDRHAYQRVARSLGYELAGPVYKIGDHAFVARFVANDPRTGRRSVARQWVRCSRDGDMWGALTFDTKRAAVAGVVP